MCTCIAIAYVHYITTRFMSYDFLSASIPGSVPFARYSCWYF